MKATLKQITELAAEVSAIRLMEHDIDHIQSLARAARSIDDLRDIVHEEVKKIESDEEQYWAAEGREAEAFKGWSYGTD